MKTMSQSMAVMGTLQAFYRLLWVYYWMLKFVRAFTCKFQPVYVLLQIVMYIYESLWFWDKKYINPANLRLSFENWHPETTISMISAIAPSTSPQRYLKIVIGCVWVIYWRISHLFPYEFLIYFHMTCSFGFLGFYNPGEASMVVC